MQTDCYMESEAGGGLIVIALTKAEMMALLIEADRLSFTIMAIVGEAIRCRLALAENIAGAKKDG